ncbi:MAG TPA: zinc ribbon domain-containing protein [Blastocatellia bacterium]|nr:zinc ribbon domain-containing protein [Blastocatellia bacterium]
MFCPKCGGEATESQRYCKTCGTHLQMIYDALGGSEHKGAYGGIVGKIDVEALSRNARKFAESWKAGWSGFSHSGAEGWKAGWTGATAENRPAKVTAPPQPQLPKPKEWLRYSWQHNLREGLLSLFAGTGLGLALYYFSRPQYIGDVLRGIGGLSHANVDLDAIARLASVIWLFAAIPVLKGLSQIIYAAFFAESMSRLTERFIPQPQQVPVVTAQQPALEAQQEPVRSFENLSEPISSVTEHTTHIIDGAPSVGRAKTNE